MKLRALDKLENFRAKTPEIFRRKILGNCNGKLNSSFWSSNFKDQDVSKKIRVKEESWSIFQKCWKFCLGWPAFGFFWELFQFSSTPIYQLFFTSTRWICKYSGLSNSCRPTFIYKSDFFWKCWWKKNQKMTAMPRLM